MGRGAAGLVGEVRRLRFAGAGTVFLSASPTATRSCTKLVDLKEQRAALRASADEDYSGRLDSGRFCDPGPGPPFDPIGCTRCAPRRSRKRAQRDSSGSLAPICRGLETSSRCNGSRLSPGRQGPDPPFGPIGCAWCANRHRRGGARRGLMCGPDLPGRKRPPCGERLSWSSLVFVLAWTASATSRQCAAIARSARRSAAKRCW
jgi:hypothetical protein